MSVSTKAFPHTKSQAAVCLAVGAGANSVQITAELTGYSQRSVQRALKELWAMGLVMLPVENLGKGRLTSIIKLYDARWIPTLYMARRRVGDLRTKEIVTAFAAAGFTPPR